MTKHVTAGIVIRAWLPEDAEGVLRVHHAAVHETAAADYGPEILQAWSAAVTAERIANYLSSTARGEETTLVAVVKRRIVGFASIVATLSELRAVYVLPDAGRRGVGSNLLVAIEQLARERGLTELHLESSLTAAPFYRTRGYMAQGSGEHILRSGLRMQCVPMRKVL